MRDYVYIPLGGNRKGELRQQINLFLTMLVGGLWHGANWTFVVWGALQGAVLGINHLWRQRDSRLGKLPSWALTFAVAIFGYVFFRSSSFTRAWQILSGMLGLNGFEWRPQPGSISREKNQAILEGLILVWLFPNRQTILEWDWLGDYSYAIAFTLLAVVGLLNLANPPAFVYFQF